MEKIINQTQKRVRLFLLAVAATAIGVSSVLSIIPVQTANAQSSGEFALIISTLCGGEPDIKDDKIECPSGVELKDVNDDDFEKFEAPPLQCEVKEDKDECAALE
ncbi:MAG: hypothetical protein M3275_10880 [Thermoproteota archaeon]|nr:hypothetical protein [Thermoproteota archaeon]